MSAIIKTTASVASATIAALTPRLIIIGVSGGMLVSLAVAS